MTKPKTIQTRQHPTATARRHRRQPLLRRFLATGISLVAATSILAFDQPAAAQNIDRDSQIDIQGNRSDAFTNSGRDSVLPGLSSRTLVLGGANNATVQQFKFSIVAPFTFNDNINSARQGGKSSWHGNPEIKLDWAKQFEGAPLKLSARFDASSDRYVGHSEADGDAAFSTLTAALTDGKDDQALKPSVAYSPHLSFDPTFAHRMSTNQDIYVGLTKAYAFDDQWTLLPVARDAMNNAERDIVITMTAGRRESDSVSSSYVKIAPQVDYQLNLEWAIQFLVAVQGRFFDKQAGVSRSDLLVNPIITISYVPGTDKFQNLGGLDTQNLLGTPEIDLQISFANQTSSVTTKRFHQLDVGPVLSAHWTF